MRKKSVIAATAIARELTGFVWAIVRAVKAPQPSTASEIIRTCRGKVYQLNPATKGTK